MNNMDGLVLFPKEIRGTVPQLYYNDENNVSANDMLIHVKFFCGAFTWYAAEWGDEDGQIIFFGYVQNHSTPSFSELGFFSLMEFEDFNRNHAFPKIERDLYFGEPKPLSQVLGRKLFKD